MRPKKKSYSPGMIILGVVLVILLAYYCAGGMREGETIFIWKERMEFVINHPFDRYLNSYTAKTIAIFLLIYALAVLMYLTSRKNYLPGREMGSAQYADVKKVNRKLADLSLDPDDMRNIAVIKRRRGTKG